MQPKLKATPDRSVEQFGVVRCRDDDDMTGQIVDLQQERADNSFDLSCLVRVAALLADHVELIEEKHASPRPDLVEEPG